MTQGMAIKHLLLLLFPIGLFHFVPSFPPGLYRKSSSLCRGYDEAQVPRVVRHELQDIQGDRKLEHPTTSEGQ